MPWGPAGTVGTVFEGRVGHDQAGCCWANWALAQLGRSVWRQPAREEWTPGLEGTQGLRPHFCPASLTATSVPGPPRPRPPLSRPGSIWPSRLELLGPQAPTSVIASPGGPSPPAAVVRADHSAPCSLPPRHRWAALPVRPGVTTHLPVARCGGGGRFWAEAPGPLLSCTRSRLAGPCAAQSCSGCLGPGRQGRAGV